MFDLTKFQINHRLLPALTELKNIATSSWEQEKGRTERDIQLLGGQTKIVGILSVAMLLLCPVLLTLAICSVVFGLVGSTEVGGEVLTGFLVSLGVTGIIVISLGYFLIRQINLSLDTVTYLTKRWGLWTEILEDLIDETKRSVTGDPGNGVSGADGDQESSFVSPGSTRH